jgi:hypothetical protein
MSSLKMYFIHIRYNFTFVDVVGWASGALGKDENFMERK